MAQNDRGGDLLNFRHISDNTVSNSRIFYVTGSRILYTKVIEQDLDSALCMQVNDPTHDQFSEVLPSDGGEVDITGAGSLTGLVSFRNGVLAASTEGCWYLSSSGAFSPLDQQLTKITDFGLHYPNSIATAGQNAFYMNQGGIVAIVTNEFETVQGTLITDNSIRSYLVDDFLHNTDAGEVVGLYDSRANEIHWTNARGQVLVFDLDTQGFYPQQLTISTRSDGSRVADVVDIVEPTDEQPNRFRYVLNRYNYDNVNEENDTQQGTIHVGTFRRDSFDDEDGVGEALEYDAYMVAGPESLGQFALEKNVTSISLAFSRTEANITGFNTTSNQFEYDNPSGCLLSTQWDISTYSGYSSTQRQVYRLNRRRWMPDSTAYPVSLQDQADNIVYFEDKVRGNGKLVSFRFDSERGKDMQLLGFAVDFSMKGRQR